MKHYFFTFACLIGLSSCTSYSNLMDYMGGIEGDDGLAYFIVNYTDADGNEVTDNVVDFEIVNKSTLRVFVYGNDPERFDSYLIHGPYQIITTF